MESRIKKGVVEEPRANFGSLPSHFLCVGGEQWQVLGQSSWKRALGQKRVLVAAACQAAAPIAARTGEAAPAVSMATLEGWR